MANELVYVNLNVVDGKNKKSTISVPFKLDSLTSVTSMLALVRAVGRVIGKLSTAGLRSAEICLGVDITTILWDDVDGLNDDFALGDVQEKAFFSFTTVPDAVGVIRSKTLTIPAVNDAVVFLPNTDSIDQQNADVEAFINMMQDGFAGLDGDGGDIADVVSAVDSRGLDLVAFQDGYATWSNRRR